MLSLFRWLVRLTIGLIAVSVGALALAWYFAVRSLPDYDASLALAGVEQPVEIVRTTENIPHILASTDRDAFFALGFAHAQDRLFQMVVLRRAAQGRLAEMFGERAYAADDLARRLGLWRHAQASLAAQDQTTRRALQAYADGVNAWVEQVNQGALGRGAPEFFLLPGDIAYWQPADSLAILKLVAAGASRQVSAEVARARVSLAAPERGGDLVRAAGEAPLPPYAALFGEGARFAAPPETAAEDWFAGLVGYIRVGRGSSANGFAASASRTAAGAPLLANDPHVALTAPSLWYLARLDLRAGSVIGGTIPGIPAVLTGRNQQLAWGLTPAWVDDQDIVMEEVQPGAPDRYLAAGGWREFSTRHEVIRIHGAEDRRITLRETESGPVIPPAHLGLQTVTPDGFVPALRWTGLSAQDTTLSALIALMQAPDRSGATKAARGIVAPAVQVTLADADGVAQVLAGEIPRRPPEHPTAGRMPAPGRDPAVRWLEPVAPDDPLRVTEPAQGMVAATGAEATGATALAVGHDRDEPLRLARLSRLLAAREIHSRDSFIDAQLDTVSPAARALLPLVGADLWFTGEAAAPGTPERQRQDALALLAEWDGNMGEHLPEPLIYSAWMQHLQLRLIHDELGALAGELSAELRPAFIDRVFRNTGGAAAWCDVVQSAPVEDCATIARQALDAALIELSARFGPDVESWRWGDAHVARHEHPALGQMPLIGWVVSLVQSTSGDGSSLARAPATGAGANPWAAVGGAGYRGVYDLADPDSSVFIIATGQSGHPLSRHYDDLAERWRRGEYVTMSLDPTLARAGARGVTVLRPLP
ncbi:penicillin acylase family protein [Paracoccus alkenifer]|uniref:Penicillin amidase n=1 Tax=Paracoccus alkenifer TaxID=65735 RepID=A0A1H6K559_9RHOB|nr:penicillin acylase family protein [Paracoccus alkenifer]SEH66920.1 penicillin amidase [Paracoccus alkenifer]